MWEHKDQDHKDCEATSYIQVAKISLDPRAKVCKQNPYLYNIQSNPKQPDWCEIASDTVSILATVAQLI